MVRVYNGRAEAAGKNNGWNWMQNAHTLNNKHKAEWQPWYGEKLWDSKGDHWSHTYSSQPTPNCSEIVPTVDQVFQSQKLWRTVFIISTIIIEHVSNFNNCQTSLDFRKKWFISILPEYKYQDMIFRKLCICTHLSIDLLLQWNIKVPIILSFSPKPFGKKNWKNQNTRMSVKVSPIDDCIMAISICMLMLEGGNAMGPPTYTMNNRQVMTTRRESIASPSDEVIKYKVVSPKSNTHKQQKWTHSVIFIYFCK